MIYTIIGIILIVLGITIIVNTLMKKYSVKEEKDDKNENDL
jgi:hypothetical protein